MCRNTHNSITHKFTEKFICYIFYVYTGTNYEADMKLNVFRWTNILLQYSMVKNDSFGLHFCFSWRRPCDYRAKCYINRKTIECLQMSGSTYPSICNSFPVIRTAIAKKLAIFTYRSPHFCFPLETSLRLPPYITHG